MPSFGNLTHWFWKCRKCIFCFFPNIFMGRWGMDLNLNKLESLSFKVALCQVWLKFALWFREDFKISSIYFRFFAFYTYLKRTCPFILNKLEFPSHTMLCVMASWFYRRKVLNSVTVFFILSPFGKGYDPSFEQF